MLSDSLSHEWILVQRKALSLMRKKNFPAALDELDSFLRADHPPVLQSEVWAFKGLVREKMEGASAARVHFLAAHSLSQPGTYQRYALEITLGRLSEELKELQEARTWYWRAVKTAADDPGTSGAAAIEGFLNLKDFYLWSQNEKQVCVRVIRQAWTLFSLPGEPDLANLEMTLHKLKEASARPLPR